MKKLYEPYTPEQEDENKIREFIRAEWKYLLMFVSPMLIVVGFFWNIKVDIVNLQNTLAYNQKEVSMKIENTNKDIADITRRITAEEAIGIELGKKVEVIWEKIFNKPTE
jgi:hypothetical protein